MNFDMSGMTQAFDRMREQAEKRGKDMATDQGNFFLRATKRLGWQAAPSKEKLFQTAQELGWRLKRKTGTTPGQELKRRMRSRGTFARGWHISKIESKRFVIRIWLENDSAESDKVDTQKKVSDRAEKQVGGRFKSRLDRLAEQVTKSF
jgi:hypothetical protein